MLCSEVKLIMDRTGLPRNRAVELAGSLQKRRRTFYIALYAIGPVVFALWLLGVNLMISALEGRGVVVVDSMALGLVLGPGLGFLAWLAASVAALSWAITRDARRCLDTPLCFACGFDLRGMPAGDPPLCPECGRPAWHSAARKAAEQKAEKQRIQRNHE